MEHFIEWIERQSRTLAAAAGLTGSDVAPSIHPPHTAGPGPKTRIIVTGSLFILIVGLINLDTPHGLDLEYFYLLGCVFVGWRAGVQAALICAAAAGAFLYLAEARDIAHPPGWILFLNVTMRLVAFAAIAWLAEQVGRLTRGLERTVQQRTAQLRSEVAEHKETADLLRDAMQLFKQVTENITDVFWVTDPSKTKVQYVSPEFEKVWGRTRRSLYVSPGLWIDGIHPDDRDRVTRAMFTKQLAGEYAEEYRVARPDGSLRWVYERAFPVKDETGAVHRLVGIAEDITERKRVERQILEISDREQARIGQDIHDGLCQQLVGIAFDANSLEQSLGAQERPEAAIAGRIARVIDEAISESRRVSRGLYPVRLETEGLVPGLKDLAGTTCERFNIRCLCEAVSASPPCDHATATNLYRIAQEAVNNALKHSGAQTVSIRIVESNDRIELTVQDDGKGIEPAPQRSSGMGLYTMDYRARSMGGSLRVFRSERGGTTVLCRVPRHK